MNFDISFGLSWYLILLGIILIVSLVYLSYFYRSNTGLNPRQRYILSSLRALALFSVLFLVAKPVVEISKQVIHKPIIAIVQDNSSSIPISFKDKNLERNSNALIKKLQKSINAELLRFRFGQKVVESDSLDFTGKYTDISAALNYVKNYFSNENLQAVVLVSDGIYNKGYKPEYTAEKFDVPVFSLGTFPDKKFKDAKIENISYNSIAYKKSQNLVKLKITKQNIESKYVVVSCRLDGMQIYTKKISVKAHGTEIEIPVQFKEKGIHILNFKITEFPGEISFDNNKSTIAIRVLDKRNKVLIVSSAPHPDVAALKESLESNFNIEVKTVLLSKMTKKPDADLIIYHQLPDYKSSDKWNKYLAKAASIKPALFILGKNADFNAFNRLKKGITIKLKSRQKDASYFSYNELQSKLSVNKTFLQLIKEAPPLFMPYANYQLNTDSKVIFYREYKGIKTTEPCMIYSPINKAYVFSTTGLWKWRLEDKKQYGLSTHFNEFINQIVLDLLQSKKRKNLLNYEPIVYEKEQVLFEYLHTDSLHKIVDLPQIKLISSQKIYKFKKISNKKYILTINRLELGKHPFLFESRMQSGAKFREKGEIHVLENKIEARNLKPDDLVMKKLAYKTGGSFVSWENRTDIVDSIQQKAKLKSIITTEKQIDDFIFNRWFFFVIFLLFVIEWALRKYWSLD